MLCSVYVLKTVVANAPCQIGGHSGTVTRLTVHNALAVDHAVNSADDRPIQYIPMPKHESCAIGHGRPWILRNVPAVMSQLVVMWTHF